VIFLDEVGGKIFVGDFLIAILNIESSREPFKTFDFLGRRPFCPIIFRA